MVLEQIVTTLASVADTAEEKFISHYDRFMPCLKYIVQNAVQQELRLLRGKTIECISLIGLAVGKEKVSYSVSEFRENLRFFMIYRPSYIVTSSIYELWFRNVNLGGGIFCFLKGKKIMMLMFFLQFLQDCSDVMQLLLKHQTSPDELADDDPQVILEPSAVRTPVVCLQLIHSEKAKEALKK